MATMFQLYFVANKRGTIYIDEKKPNINTDKINGDLYWNFQPTCLTINQYSH
jgi:hypothetical protein